MNTNTNTDTRTNVEYTYNALANIEKLQSCSNLSADCIDKKCANCNSYTLLNSVNKFNFSMGQSNVLNGALNNGITVIRGDHLPNNTIIVSKDIYEQIRKSDL